MSDVQHRCCLPPPLQAGAQEVARTAVAELVQRMGQEPLPLAMVVPIVSAVAQDAMAPSSPSIPALAQLEGVRSLAAMVYSCEPPL